MARPRRGTRKRRVRKDWVYNREAYGPLYSVNAGVPSHQAIPLTYSKSSLLTVPNAAALPPFVDYIPNTAFPEGKSQMVHAVDCWLFVTPQTWVAGNTVAFGARVLKAEMDPPTQLALFDPDYTMWSLTPAGSEAVHWADDGGILVERRFAQDFTSDAPSWNIRIKRRFPFPVRLANDEALFLYLEMLTGTVGVRVRTFSRALMSAG